MTKHGAAVPEKAAEGTKALAPIDHMRNLIQSLTAEFKAALPPQIPVERFIRTTITTIQMNPDLLKCDRKSVLATCMKAAQDGLLLDGREAAAIPFGSTCQYIPMVAGVLKKMRNSGEIASVAAHSVHENDHFEYVLGDEEKIIHVPKLGERGKLIAAYAIIRTKDGGIYREVMNKEEIEKVRNVSKAKNNGPWVTWYEEQAEKTVLKRIAKRCPSSADIEQVIAHDNEVVGFAQRHGDPVVEVADEAPKRPSYLAAIAEAEKAAEAVPEKDAGAGAESGKAGQDDDANAVE